MRMRTAGDRGLRNHLSESLVEISLDAAWCFNYRDNGLVVRGRHAGEKFAC